MWDGFGRKARGKVLSGLRGAGFRDGEGAEKQKRRFWKKEKIGGRLNRQTDKTGGKTSHLFDTGENGGRNDLETAAEPIIQEEEQVSLTGTWKCGEGEVIFTESGSMMLGLNSIVLGGGWVQYEVIDTKTLHITGGGLPVGMNISYTLDGDYLSLELNDTTITFTKK